MKKMTLLERCLTVIRGGIPDRVPVCLHNFMAAAKEAGIPLERCLTEPESAARAHLQAVETYGHDCILVDLDTTMLAEAMVGERTRRRANRAIWPRRPSAAWTKSENSSPPILPATVAFPFSSRP